MNHSVAEVTYRGIHYDRHWAIIDKNHQVITARDFPQLLKISCQINEKTIEFMNGVDKLSLPLTLPENPINIQIFRHPTEGVDTSIEADQWFSNFLGFDCRLVFQSPLSARVVMTKNGGQEGDALSYADQCPILLLSTASVDDLNHRLEEPVTLTHFRPNLVVEGCDPYEEDTWKRVRIGECEFDVAQLCQRCVFITIDPKTGKKHPKQEPLRTLSSYKKHPKGGVAFGVHLIPRKIGSIKINDSLEVIS